MHGLTLFSELSNSNVQRNLYLKKDYYIKARKQPVKHGNWLRITNIVLLINIKLSLESKQTLSRKQMGNNFHFMRSIKKKIAAEKLASQVFLRDLELG